MFLGAELPGLHVALGGTRQLGPYEPTQVIVHKGSGQVYIRVDRSGAGRARHGANDASRRAAHLAGAFARIRILWQTCRPTAI